MCLTVTQTPLLLDLWFCYVCYLLMMMMAMMTLLLRCRSGGKVLWCVCRFVCICLSVSLRHDISEVRNHTRDLYRFLMLPMAMARSSSGRLTKSQGKGQFWEFSSPLTMHCNASAAKGIIQSPITPCSRRDNSLCQASANRNPENSERRRCGLSAGKGVMGVHSAGEVWYVQLPCFLTALFSYSAFTAGRVF